MSGTLYLVLGSSGVGKDSLIDGSRDIVSKDYVFVTRTITRLSDEGVENHQYVNELEFQNMVNNGEFVLHWKAHGLHYGIPSKQVYDGLETGKKVIANISRKVVLQAQELFSNVCVIEVTASIDKIRERLLYRGRESEQEIKQRIHRGQEMSHQVVSIAKNYRRVVNDGTLQEGIQAFLKAIDH
jgi:phosphonate metabolism protein PhnN/1,5-bisphosphokinase (PRPP-forming)